MVVPSVDENMRKYSDISSRNMIGATTLEGKLEKISFSNCNFSSGEPCRCTQHVGEHGPEFRGETGGRSVACGGGDRMRKFRFDAQMPAQRCPVSREAPVEPSPLRRAVLSWTMDFVANKTWQN